MRYSALIFCKRLCMQNVGETVKRGFPNIASCHWNLRQLRWWELGDRVRKLNLFVQSIRFGTVYIL